VEKAIPQQSEAWAKRAEERTWAVIQAVREIAERHGVSASQVALNWLRAKPPVTAPILGARSVQQLEDNLGCLDWELTEEEVAQLDQVSAVETPYPYDFIDRSSTDRLSRAASG
jgi:aryl-alcohol dehydrogenase-like predicted oxidoreductase